jgi:Putative beta-barrel porin 2
MEKTNQILAVMAILCVALVTPNKAAAQVTPDVTEATIQGQQIIDAANKAAQTRQRTGQTGGDIINGEAGIFVLTVNDIYSVSLSGGAGYTDNATRTADNIDKGYYSDFGLSAGISTKLAEKVDFGFSGTIGGREFADEIPPSNRTVSSNISLGAKVGRTPLYFSVVGFGGYSFDGKFKNANSFYGVSSTLSASMPIGQRLFVRPSLGVTRQMAGVSENNSTSLSGSLELVARITPKLTGSLRGVVTGRLFDDFYEDVTFVERQDTQYQIGGSLSYRLSKFATLSASASYEKQGSKFFLSQYTASDAAFGLSVRVQF